MSDVWTRLEALTRVGVTCDWTLLPPTVDEAITRGRALEAEVDRLYGVIENIQKSMCVVPVPK